MVIKVGNVVGQVKSRYSTSKILGLVFKLLLVIMGAVIPVCAFVDTFKIRCSYTAIILTAVAGTVIFALIVSGRRTKVLFIILISIAFVAYVIMYGSELKEGTLNIANVLISAYNKYVSANAARFDVSFEHIVRNNTMVICAVVFEITFLLVTATWYRVYGPVHVLITLIVIFPVMLLGYMPNMWYMTAIVIYFLMVMAGRRTTARNKKKNIISSNSYRINDCINAKAYIYLAIAAIATVLVTMLVVEPKEYDRDASLDKVKTYIEKQLKKIDFLHVGSNSRKASGGMSGGRLGQADYLEYNNESVMRITVPADSDGYYIKGFTGAEYDGDIWKEYEESNREKYRFFMSEQTDIMSMTERGLMEKYEYETDFRDLYRNRANTQFSIELTGADRHYFYYPYYANLTEYIQDCDLKIKSDMPKQITYNVFDFPISDYDSLPDLIDADFDYQTYVYSAFQENWTYEVNDEVYNVINTESGSADLIQLKDSNYEECIEAVQKYLKDNMTYSMKPGHLKTGMDFIENFLLYSKHGYCTHFATAATMMFRAEGIPARYVEGYAITNKQYKKNLVSRKKVMVDGATREYYEIDIKDTCAHAWVEIYVNGFGWVPVEVTPGYENAIQGEVETTNENQTTTGTQTTTSKQTTTNAGKPTTSNNKSGKQSHIDYSVAIKTILILLAVILVSFVIAYIEKIRMQRVYEQLHSENNRSNILYADRYLNKLCRMQGVNLPEKLTENEKAGELSHTFGLDEQEMYNMYHMIERAHFDSEEADFDDENSVIAVRGMYECSKAVYDNGKILKKFIIRYVWCLLEK